MSNFGHNFLIIGPISSHQLGKFSGERIESESASTGPLKGYTGSDKKQRPSYNVKNLFKNLNVLRLILSTTPRNNEILFLLC